MLKEWAAAAFRFERLLQMMDEIYHHHRDFEKIVKVYVGTIGGYSSAVTKTDNPHPYIDHVNFCVEFTANAYSGLEDEVMDSMSLSDDAGTVLYVGDDRSELYSLIISLK